MSNDRFQVANEMEFNEIECPYGKANEDYN